MSEILSAATAAAGVNGHPVFAAGMEAAVVFKMMAKGEDVITDNGNDKLHLLSINREVYRSFAQAYGYKYIIFLNEQDKRDGWRFYKQKE